MGRNTLLLKEIVTVLDSELDDTEYALDALESHFHDALLVNAGNVTTVGTFTEQLRLNIDHEECSAVLDHLADQKIVGVTDDHVEQTVWDLFGNRFIEPS